MSFENLSNYTPLGGATTFTGGAVTSQIVSPRTAGYALGTSSCRIDAAASADYMSFYTSNGEALRITNASTKTFRFGTSIITWGTGFSGEDTGLKRLAAATIGPISDDTHDLGDGSNRFQDIYATNTTIQSSDERLKTEIRDCPLGLDFINSLRPVAYKWRDYDFTVTVTDENGNETTETRRKTHHRSHAGLIAQDVKAALEAAGVDPGKVAAFIDPEATGKDGFMGLRYAELIAPMIKAIQQLTERVNVLERLRP